MADIDWESINSKLPFQRTDEEKAKRQELFKQFDPNSNGYLSLAEVRKTKFMDKKCYAPPLRFYLYLLDQKNQ